MKKTETKEPTKVVAQRTADGKFLPGHINIGGKPSFLGHTSLDKLLASIRRVESDKNKSLLDHYISRAFKSDQVLISVMKKLMPDLAAIAAYSNEPSMSDEMAISIRKQLQERYKENERSRVEKQPSTSPLQ